MANCEHPKLAIDKKDARIVQDVVGIRIFVKAICLECGHKFEVTNATDKDAEWRGDKNGDSIYNAIGGILNEG